LAAVTERDFSASESSTTEAPYVTEEYPDHHVIVVATRSRLSTSEEGRGWFGEHRWDGDTNVYAEDFEDRDGWVPWGRVEEEISVSKARAASLGPCRPVC
jgi:hypothetical protein